MSGRAPQEIRHYIDSSPIPTWGVAGDGSRVKLPEDERLQEEYAAWLAEACQHSAQFTGKTVSSIGAEMYRRYCKCCGIATTQFLPHRTVEATVITLIDTEKRDALIEKYIEERREALDAIANEAADRAQPENRAGYSDYLAGPEWREKSALVRERCGNMCEGCRKHPVDDVHHLSYRHIGREFLFELVGLCRGCHTRWHAST